MGQIGNLPIKVLTGLHDNTTPTGGNLPNRVKFIYDTTQVPYDFWDKAFHLQMYVPRQRKNYEPISWFFASDGITVDFSKDALREVYQYRIFYLDI